MYGHQVVDSLKKSPVNNMRSNVLMKLAIDIRNAKHFYFGEMDKVLVPLGLSKDAIPFHEEHSVFINPPYDLCWFDYEMQNTLDEQGFLGALLHFIDMNFIHIILFTGGDNVSIAPNPISFIVSVHKKFEEHDPAYIDRVIGFKKLKLAFTPNIMLSDCCGLMPNYPTDEDQLFQLGKFSYSMLYPINASLKLLNCKNIGTESNSPSSSRKKHKMYSKKQPLFSYKTLKIELSKNNKSGKVTQPFNDQNSNRLHLSRGHFKTYTAEKPLFGKNVGRYWWPPTIKGDKTKGMIDKDYVVE